MNNQRPISVVIDGLTHAWPGGTTTLRDLSVTFPTSITGVIGANGSGKTTLLRLIAGELKPTSGTVHVQGSCAWIDQNLLTDPHRSIANVLGIDEQLRAIEAVANGDTAVELYDIIGNDWDIEARARAALSANGLDSVDLDDTVGECSGGQVTRTALLGAQLKRCDITLLDEPTNNLDREGRRQLLDQIASWHGTLIIVSHDRELLDAVDGIVEIRGGKARTYGVNYTGYLGEIEAEQRAAQQALRTATQQLKQQRKVREETQTKIARRARTGKNAAASNRAPRITLNLWKAEAQVSAGALMRRTNDSVRAATDNRDAALERIRADHDLMLTLPDPEVPNSRLLATFTDGVRSVDLVGPQRMVVGGDNGIGKSRMLSELVGDVVPDSPFHARCHTQRVAMLTQDGLVLTHQGVRDSTVDSTSADTSVIDYVTDHDAQMTRHDAHAALAEVGLRGRDVDRPIAALSGGERIRVALAVISLVDPAPELLVLDEPTNNLDMDSIEMLVSVLGDYGGGIIVVSHDAWFIDQLEADRDVELGPGGLDILR